MIMPVSLSFSTIACTWLKRQFFLCYWSEHGLEKENLLHAVMQFLLPRKYLIAVDQGWNDRDVIIHSSIWSAADLKVAVENHGGSKRFFRIRCRLRESVLSRISLLSFTVLSIIGWYVGLAEIAEVAVLLGLLNLAIVASDQYRFGRDMYHVIEIIGKQLDLNPVDGATAK